MLPEWVVTVSNLSGPALLVVIFWLGWSRKWVWGHHYDEMKERARVDQEYATERLLEMRTERDQYKDMLFRALKAAEAAVGRSTDARE